MKTRFAVLDFFATVFHKLGLCAQFIFGGGVFFWLEAKVQTGKRSTFSRYLRNDKRKSQLREALSVAKSIDEDAKISFHRFKSRGRSRTLLGVGDPTPKLDAKMDMIADELDARQYNEAAIQYEKELGDLN